MTIAIREYGGISARISEDQSYETNLRECLLAKARALADGDTHSAGNASRGAAECYRRLGRVSDAHVEYAGARALLSRSGSPVSLGWAAFAHGSLLRQTGDFRGSLVSLRQALSVGRLCRDIGLSSYSYAGVAENYRILGHYAIARRMHATAHDLFRNLGDVRGVVWALEGEGQILGNSGLYARAREMFVEAARLATVAHDVRGLAYALKCEGECLASLGGFSGAVARLTAALEIFTGLQLKTGMAYTTRSLADVYRLGRQETVASDLYGSALRMFESATDSRGTAYTLNGLAALRAQEGADEEAFYFYATSAKFFRGSGVRVGLSQSERGLRAMSARSRSINRLLDLWHIAPAAPLRARHRASHVLGVP